MADRKNKPTYERLYDMNKEKKIKDEKNSSPPPKVKREKPVDHKLYDDAKRIYEEHKMKKQEFDKINDQPKEKRYKNEESEKYVISKFDKSL
jgi:hypothetical protein